MTTYLVHIVVVDGGVKGRVEVVKQINHLKRSAVGADCCEPHDIREVDGDLIELLWGHLEAHLQLVCYGTNKKSRGFYQIFFFFFFF